MTSRIINGDCREVLATLDAGSVQCCVTSPPYFGLRDYGVNGQIGLEQSPDAYVAEMVAVFREVRRVLRDDGTVWLNIGDSYNADGRKGRAHMGEGKNAGYSAWVNKTCAGTKPKDLLGIPWMVAFALRADGWWLRSAITWCKQNAMPESVCDRPSSATEMVFLLAKSPKYFFDNVAIAEPAVSEGRAPGGNHKVDSSRNDADRDMTIPVGSTRNARNWWVINSQPFAGSHFATMPADLAERCIKAGTRPGDTVLDPFAGAGTTLMVASRLGRSAVGIELNPSYAELARRRIYDDCPMFSGLDEAAD